jgi:hypothetical protein
MSTSRTGSAQLARLFDLGLSVGLLPPRRDVDRPEDAEAVATTFPDLDFSRCWSRLLAARPVRGCAHLFDQVYAGQATVSSRTVADAVDDQAFLLEVDRWSAAADVVDEMVVSRCEPPVIDLGCGPGRMVRALTRSGRAALGVDISRVAVAASLAQGGPTLQRMVSEPLPAEGRWGTALLMDSNVGIGGNVTALLARCRDLVGAGGLVLCEVDPQRERHEVHDVVLRTSGVSSRPMAWSQVGAATLTRLASALDMVLAEEWVAGGRAFVALRVR